MGLESRGVLARVAAVICMMLLLEQTPLVTTVTALATETSFSHSPPPYIQPWRRTIINTKISDSAGIKLARCYFRASQNAEYVYVTMEAGADNTFTATLPALGNIAKSLQYRLLAVNNTGQVVRTAEFVAPVNHEWSSIPAWQTADYSNAIQVSTEAEQTAVAARGLLRVDDTVTIASTDPSERYLSNPSADIQTVTNDTTKPDVIASIANPPESATSPVTTLAIPKLPEQSAITSNTTNPMLVAEPPSSSASQKEATPKSDDTSTIMGMKSSTFWWIVAGVAAVVIGGTVAALNSGGGSGSGAKTGSVGVHWGNGGTNTGSVGIHW